MRGIKFVFPDKVVQIVCQTWPKVKGAKIVVSYWNEFLKFSITPQHIWFNRWAEFGNAVDDDSVSSYVFYVAAARALDFDNLRGFRNFAPTVKAGIRIGP